MLKKLTSVLAIALVFSFVLAGIAAAAPGPGQLTRVGPRSQYTNENGYLKDASKDLGQVEAVLDLSQPPLGKPSAACAIDNLTNGVGHFAIGNYIGGAETYAVFQDPAAECGGAPYTFQVWGVVFPMRQQAGTGSFTFNARAQLYAADMTDPLCPVPGALLYEGPIVSKTAGATRTDVEVNFDEWIPACVDGPYFAAMNFPDFFGYGNLRLYINHQNGVGGTTFVPCAFLNEYGTGWEDVGPILCCLAYPPPYGPLPGGGVNGLMWSYGFTNPDNECHLPGVCTYNFGYHCTQPAGYVTTWTIPASWADALFGPGSADPNNIPSTAWFTRFTNTTPCTLLSAQFLARPNALGGPDPDVNISIYNVDPVTLLPTTLLYGPVNFTTAQIFGPGGNFNYVGGNVFGAPVLPIGDFAVVCEPGPATLANLYDPITNPTGNALAFWSDIAGQAPATCTVFPCRSGAAVGVLGDALYYFCDPLLQGAGYSPYEWRIRVSRCCAPPKVEAACPAILPDIWPTHAHDYGRTSATTMGLGTNPCDIALAWKATSTKAFIFFNTVSIANDRVYYTDDQAVHCNDLASGALLWVYSDPAGIITASGMRNNLTIDGDFLYASGGTGQSFFCLNALTGALVWSRDFLDPRGPLGGQTRYGVSVVTTIGTDKIVVTGDEAGGLWAFEALTGNNYALWGSNPVALNGGIWHSPAYDGSQNLFVATATGNIYKVAVATGAATLLYTEPSGDPFRSGCSYDATEGMIYAASYGASPIRVKLDATGAVAWSFAQPANLYGTPTIGRKKVYFPQYDPTAGVNVPGVQLINKANGALEFNFGTLGVDEVPQPVTLTCDNYMFMGDALGQWSLVDVVAKTVVWKRQFQAFVYGTALAHHSTNGKDYAVMSTQLDAAQPLARGGVFCWDLTATPRPMMEQLVFEDEIEVPLGTTTVTGYHLEEVISNFAGCADLNVAEPLPAFNLNPPTAMKITPKITTVSKDNAKFAEKSAEQSAGTEYLSFFEERAAKLARMSGTTVADDPEGLNQFKSRVLFKESKARANLAAGADFLRTSNVMLDTPGPISGGEVVGLTWDYDATGLARGVDVEYIEIQSDDPDFYPEDPTGAIFGYPYVQVSYLGGCPFEWHHSLYFNGFEAWRTETVSNFGEFSDAGVGAEGLNWGGIYTLASGFLFDGGLFIIQEGYPNVAASFYGWGPPATGGDQRRFLPNPSPYAGVCGIDYQDYIPGYGRSVVVDWYDGGNCPPVLDEDYLDVLVEFTACAYVDSFEATSTAMGVEVTQVEIGAYDFGSGYGDFKLIEFKITNRDAVAKNNFYSGVFIDWDVPPTSGRNARLIVPEAGAYAIWDSGAGGTAFGMMALPAYTSTVSSDKVDGASYKMLWGINNNYRVYYNTCTECSFFTPAQDANDPEFIDFITTYNGYGYDPITGGTGDQSGIFAWPKYNLAANGEQHLYTAVFGVDASSNDKPTIAANMESMAFRINKWAGFARGDVNDDGRVDAIDVCYLACVVGGSGLPIFPWDGNGDVDLSTATDGADVTYLFNYLMGGPAPLGAWRFDFMP